MNISLVDLIPRYKDERKLILKSIDKVLSKGKLVLTKELEDFEKKVANYTNNKYCLGLNSGTDALMLSLWSLGIGKGDEVITSPLSFVATLGSIMHVGAKPVFVDVKDDFNMNEELIESKITKKTKAIMPVHWAGRMCNMLKIKKIAKKYNLKIIEDAAQAMGAYYKSKHAGYYSDISAFSCHPLKNLNALGDGGFVVTNKKSLYDKIKIYRNHGLKKRDHVVMFGVNSRLDVINAEVLKIRLRKLRKVIIKRTKNINLYKKYLKENKFIKFIKSNKDYLDSNTLFLTRVKKRKLLIEHLKKKKIQTMIYYGTPLHFHPAAKKLGYGKGSLKVAEKLTKEVLAFPHHQYLRNSEIKYICKEIKNFYNKYEN
jgi:dTDP-4-amino-4,6-dideoxygalactose transaminase